MIRIMWVPKEYKNFSFSEIAEDAKRVLAEVEELQKRNNRIYADLMILQNKVANLSEEEARHNLGVLIPWLESQLKGLGEDE